MFRVSLGKEKVVYSKGKSSKGTQLKYRDGKYWYKIDNLGNEGLVEYLTYLVLKNSSLSAKEYVRYEPGVINGKTGCRSVDFSCNGKYNFISLNHAYRRVVGGGLYEKVNSFGTPESRAGFILGFFRKYYKINLEGYFRKVFSIGLITLNEDRHFNNLGFLTYNGNVLEAPIFDNGLALLTGNYSVNKRLPIKDNVSRMSSKPFSGSPDRQYSMFGRGFTVDYIGLFTDLLNVSECFEKDVLVHQLKKYSNIFFESSLFELKIGSERIGTRILSNGKYYDTNVKLSNTCKSIPLRVIDGVAYSKEELEGLHVSNVSSRVIHSLFSSLVNKR